MTSPAAPAERAPFSATGIDACDRCLALSELMVRLCSVPLLRGTAEFAERMVPDPADDDTPKERPEPAPLVEPLVASAEGLDPTPAELVRAAHGVSAERARELRRRFAGWSADALRAYCGERGISVACRCSTDFPPSLLELADPPHVLYARGDLRLLDDCPAQAIAMVGTRRPTRVGREASRTIAAGIAQLGGIVVSGMALGVDGAAHDGALGVGGRSIAVLASGVDRPSPPSHRQLYDHLVATGLVVSELPPGTQPDRWSFPARNRIIAGLSDAVVVVEAPRKSGALITVDHAQDLGLDVYAVPGSLAAPTCEGSNQLLCEGAGGVVDGVALMAGRRALAGVSPPPLLTPSDARQAELYAALLDRALNRHELGAAIGVDVAMLDVALVDLEIAGWIQRGHDGRYVATRRC